MQVGAAASCLPRPVNGGGSVHGQPIWMRQATRGVPDRTRAKAWTSERVQVALLPGRRRFGMVSLFDPVVKSRLTACTLSHREDPSGLPSRPAQRTLITFRSISYFLIFSPLYILYVTRR